MYMLVILLASKQEHRSNLQFVLGDEDLRKTWTNQQFRPQRILEIGIGQKKPGRCSSVHNGFYSDSAQRCLIGGILPFN